MKTTQIIFLMTVGVLLACNITAMIMYGAGYNAGYYQRGKDDEGHVSFTKSLFQNEAKSAEKQADFYANEMEKYCFKSK